MIETQTTKNRRPLVLTLVFFAGLVFFLFACHLTAGDLHQYNTTDCSKIYLFLYANLPCAIHKLLGVNDISTFGILYTLVASGFFLTMGVLLYSCPTNEEFSDEADAQEADSLLRRALHYLCAFPFFQMICLACIDIKIGTHFVTDPGLYCFVAPILFLLFTILELFPNETPAQKWKSICRLLASVSVTLGIAGIGNRLFYQDIKVEVLTIAIRRFLIQFAELCGTGFGGMIAMLLLMVVCLALLVLCFWIFFRTAKNQIISQVCFGGHILLLFVIGFYTTYFSKSWEDATIGAKGICYWLFMVAEVLTFVAIGAQKSWRRGGAIFASSIGIFTLLPALLDCLRAFSGNISHNLSQLAALGLPIEKKAFELVSKYCPKGHWSYVVFLIALLIGVLGLFILLYLPIIKCSKKKADELSTYEYPWAFPLIPIVCSLAFVLGYGIICLSNSILNIPWVRLVGYSFCAPATIVAAFCLTLCIILRYSAGIRLYLIGAGSTLVCCVVLTCFAQIITAVVCGIAICFAIFAFFASNLAGNNGKRKKSTIQYERMQNLAQGASILEDLEASEKSGEMSSAEAGANAYIVAQAMRQRDAELREELDNLD